MRNPRKLFWCFTVLGLFSFSLPDAASAKTAEQNAERLQRAADTLEQYYGASAKTAEQIAESALAATVFLEMTDRNGKTLGFGSGFFVGQNQIATNFHVIEGAAKGTAKQVGKSAKYTIEGITEADEKNDLAIVKVTAWGVEPLPLGDSDTLKIGETVYVAGNPRGLEGTFSDGIISSLRKADARNRIQMTAPISPGSSGGPVLNRKGEVIGVSSMIVEGGQNLNFAVPSNYLKALLKQVEPAKPLAGGSISAETYFLRGIVYHDLGNYDEAIAAYTQAIRLKPDHADAYNNRGLAKQNLGLHRAAITDYDAAIRLKPDEAEAYYNRGIAKYKLGQHRAAIADYDTAIHLKPDHANAYYNRGLAKGELGEYFAAIADYDAAIRLKPDDVEAYYNRGSAKVRLSQYRAAIADLDTAIHLRPDNAKAYLNRGIAKYLQYRTWEAKQDLRTALRLANRSGDTGLKAKAEEALKLIER